MKRTEIAALFHQTPPDGTPVPSMVLFAAMHSARYEIISSFRAVLGGTRRR